MDPVTGEGPKWRGSFLVGFVLAGGMNLVALVLSIALLFRGMSIFLLHFFGLWQVLWLLPVYLPFRRRGETDTCKGILVGGAITVLLSAICGPSSDLNWMHLW